MPAAFHNPSEIARKTDGPLLVDRYSDYLASDHLKVFPGAGSMVVRRDVFLAAGGFSETRMGAEDAELFLRLGTAPGFTFVRSPALVAYRMHQGSFSLSVDAGLTGRWEMLRRERAGGFPGGPGRRADRRRIITSHCRSATVVALRSGQVRDAMHLYANTAGWHLIEGRWKYLLGFPLLAARTALLGADPAQAGQGFLPAAPRPALPEAAAPAHAESSLRPALTGPTPLGAHVRGPIRAAVVLATRNRKDELRRALQSCFAQTVPVHVVVRDDGSTDGSLEMVRAEFPTVDIVRHEHSRGSIPSRNDAVEALRGVPGCEIVFSIDDDAAFSSPRTIEQTLAEFDHPRVGIVAIPFIDVLKGDTIEQAAPPVTSEHDRGGVWVLDTFRGCAAAWRRDLFLGLGGYTPVFRHMAEEPDLALRALDAGFIVRAGRADPVHHYESPNRNWDKIWFQIARNGVLQGWMTAPWWMVPPHLAGTVAASLRVGLRQGNLRVMARGVADGFRTCLGAGRASVSAQAYFLCRWLRRRKPIRLEAIEARLPGQRSFSAQSAPVGPTNA